MPHANAALTPRHRLKVAQLVIDDGYPISEVAARFQVSWPTVKRWVDRYIAGESMTDRSSRPRHQPGRTPQPVVRRVLELRWRKRLGPLQLAARTGIAPYLAQRWAELGEHPLVGEARIAGMVGALELVPDKSKRAFFKERGNVGVLCRDMALKNGLILRATYDSMLLSPPLIITREQVDELFEKTWKSLNETAAAL